MKGSLKIGSFAGIGVYIHWTFSLLLIYVLWMASVAEGATAGTVALSFVFVAAIFLCVVLHEFGHALTARRFGVRTRDITLLPIGGMARMERIPENPTQELLIAIAGPAVNVLIAIILIMGGAALAGADGIVAESESLQLDRGTFLNITSPMRFWLLLTIFNIIIVIFNMLPGFPMDGGRVLRAALAYFLDYVRATQVAARVGQGVAIIFALMAIGSFSPILFLVAVFVFFAGPAEAHAVRVRTAFRGRTARDAMITRFAMFHPNDPLSRVVEELLAGWQTDFPIVGFDGELLGHLTSRQLTDALSRHGPDAPVSSAMQQTCPSVAPDEPLERCLDALQSRDCDSIPVVEGRTLIGLLTPQNASELMAVRAAMRARRTAD